MAIEGSFDPHAIERDLYAEWERSGVFAPSGDGSAFCIAIPPPNVTDRLHIGHAFQHTLMDALIRYRRMDGQRTLWQTGTDHAQIATQMVVERQLAAQGITLQDIGRDAFIDKVWQWKAETGGNISQQIRRMGSSVDWQRERFTMDEGFSRAVIEVFVRLYEDGLIYRGQRLVNWDPALRTSISDLEVENTEEPGHLWHLRYPLVGRGDGGEGQVCGHGKDYLVVATTRPETMLGDSAVAVHPDDERFAALVGQEVELPLTGRRIPIIADDYVDREFGSGCVKITPAHDFNDNAIGARHGLPVLNIFDASASINDNAPAAYRGLDRFEARRRIVADLDAAGLIDRIEDYATTVPRGDRSKAIVEPWLTDQWFVKIGPLAAPAIEAVESGAVRFVPKQYENMYFAWMREIQDWCISRQQWWGHRIPAWYDDAGNVYVGRTEAEARASGGLAENAALRQDDDVLDTWFSSALWTFGTLGWPQKTPALAQFHPTNVLVTGYDIIFFWVARMIMMALRFTGEVPFRTVYIHGMVRDADGAKMSKTKGNGLDPLDLVDGIATEALVAKRTANMTQPQMADAIAARTRREYPHGIEAHGADALRFTFCALASQGRDLAFDLRRVAGYRNFCNKLWNAAKFVLSHVEGADLDGPAAPTAADRWIRSLAGKLATTARESIAAYRFDLYANAVYDFAWHEYCDWYLELTKPVLFASDAPPERVLAAKKTLLEVLETLLRIAHPIVPFITEQLWRHLAPAAGHGEGSIMRRPFPTAAEQPQDADAEFVIERLKGMVAAVRNIRGEMNISPAKEVRLLLQGGDERDRELFAETEFLLRRLAKVESAAWLADNDQREESHGEERREGREGREGREESIYSMQMVGDLKVMVPLAGIIDVATERERLRKEIGKLQKERSRALAKLTNQNFLAKAPAAVVAKERDKSAGLQKQFDALNAQLDRLLQADVA